MKLVLNTNHPTMKMRRNSTAMGIGMDPSSNKNFLRMFEIIKTPGCFLHSHEKKTPIEFYFLKM